MESHQFYMEAAIAEAIKAGMRDEVPIGAVLVNIKTGQIVAAHGNATIAQADPTAHAEILVVRDMCRQLNAQRLPEYDLYVTLEPCPMCAAALSFARVRRVVFGALDPKSGGLESLPALKNASQLHHKYEVIGGVCAEECSQLLKNFFAKARQRGSQYLSDKTRHSSE